MTAKAIRLRSVLPLVAVAALGGCATRTISTDRHDLSEFATREFGSDTTLHQSAAARAAATASVRERLTQPLAVSDAVWIALNHSPRFQQLLADSAAASAATAQSARLPNPVLRYAKIAAGHVTEIDRVLSFSLLDLMLLPQRRRMASLQRAQQRLRSAGEVVAMATAVRRAWIEAVAAQQSLVYARQVRDAAEVGAELARRMEEAGNFARIEQAREQLFHADAMSELTRTTLAAERAREQLVRTIGLSRELAVLLRLPERLPDLPDEPLAETIVEQHAFEGRLDIALARAELEYTARALGLTRVTGTVNALEIGPADNRVSGEDRLKGYDLEVRLPIFDFGDAHRVNARARYLASLNHSAAAVVEAQSQLRESFATYKQAFGLAQHFRDVVIPLRRSIAAQNQLLYNGMLISVFELLADKRAQITAVRETIAAQRDFWIADTALRATVIGRPTEGPALGSTMATSIDGRPPLH